MTPEMYQPMNEHQVATMRKTAESWSRSPDLARSLAGGMLLTALNSLAAATARVEREEGRAQQYRATIEDIYATVIRFGALPMTEEARQIVASFCRIALSPDAAADARAGTDKDAVIAALDTFVGLVKHTVIMDGDVEAAWNELLRARAALDGAAGTGETP